MDEGRLDAPTASRLLAFEFSGETLFALVPLVLVLLYLAGVVRLWRHGRRWPVMRLIAFTLGCAIWGLAVSLGVNAYAHELVSALVFQQFTLMTVVPPLVILGSPGRLLLRAAPHRGLGRLLLVAGIWGIRSPLARMLLHPIVAIVIAAAMFFGLYLSDLVSIVMATPLGHETLLVLFLVVGIIAATPLWSNDPLPRRPSYTARLADVFIELQIHAVFGLVLLLSSAPLFAAFATPPGGWGIDPVRDQAIAGMLAWTYGELPLLIVLIVTLSKWRKRDLAQAVRRQDEDDAELERYNAHLEQLRDRDAERSSPT